MNEELQVENGNYTRIVNKVIDELVKTPLLGTELAVCLFVLRKTWGFNKKEDEISLTQFEMALNRSRPTIAKALKNLQLVNILKLVRKGNSKESSNCWVFNKYYDTWKVVKGSKLVKFSYSTSKENIKQLVKTSKHTKDNIQKTITKDNISKEIQQAVSYGDPDINSILSFLRESVTMIDGSQRENRRFASLLLKKLAKTVKDPTKKVEAAKYVISRGLESDFHSKNLTSMKYIYNNAGKILQEAKGMGGIKKGNQKIYKL